MRNKIHRITLILLIGIVCISTISVSTVADASDASLSVTDLKVKKDITKLQARLDLVGFAPAPLEYLELTLNLRNVGNGENATIIVNVGTGEITKIGDLKYNLTTKKIQISKDFSELRVTADISEFTPARLDYLEMKVGLLNTDDNVSAETVVNVGTGLPPDETPGGPGGGI